jgi:hypothetical protein
MREGQGKNEGGRGRTRKGQEVVKGGSREGQETEGGTREAREKHRETYRGLKLIDGGGGGNGRGTTRGREVGHVLDVGGGSAHGAEGTIFHSGNSEVGLGGKEGGEGKKGENLGRRV